MGTLAVALVTLVGHPQGKSSPPQTERPYYTPREPGKPHRIE
ncbi:MAG: hypothetical protein ACJ788_18120 [Ktedonobacteraceae bacterium]